MKTMKRHILIENIMSVLNEEKGRPYLLTITKPHCSEPTLDRTLAMLIKEGFLEKRGGHKHGVFIKIKEYDITPKVKDPLKKRYIQKKRECSFEEFKSWYEKQPNVCFYCRRTLKEALDYSLHIRKFSNVCFEIDRKDSNQGYSVGNMVLACTACNSIKSNFFTSEEMLIIGEIISSKVITKQGNQVCTK